MLRNWLPAQRFLDSPITLAEKLISTSTARHRCANVENMLIHNPLVPVGRKKKSQRAESNRFGLDPDLRSRYAPQVTSLTLGLNLHPERLVTPKRAG